MADIVLKACKTLVEQSDDGIFLTSLPTFANPEKVAAGISEVVVVAVNGIKDQVLEDFDKVYSDKQKESVTQAFDKLLTGLSKTITADSIEFIQGVHKELKDVKVA